MATESITVNVGGQPSITVAVDVEQVGGTTPPAFLATMRGLSPGDDAPIDTYASDLAGYVADIDEAQALLDAAEAAGDVAAAIALLSGGGGGVPEYDTLQEVITAIAAAELVEGDAWRITWTGDTYLGDGDVVGTVRRGVPSWGGLLPAPLLGTTPTTAASAGAGARTTDGAGRLRLTVGASNTDEIVADLGFATRPLRRYLLALRYTSATPSSTTEALLQARLAVGSSWQGRSLAYFGSWQSRQDASSGGGSLIAFAPSVPTFATAARVDLDLTSGPSVASPQWAGDAVAGTNLSRPSSGSSHATGLGDWRSPTLEVRPQLLLASSGIAGQVDLIGVLCEV